MRAQLSRRRITAFAAAVSLGAGALLLGAPSAFANQTITPSPSSISGSVCAPLNGTGTQDVQYSETGFSAGTLQYSATNLPQGITIDPFTGAFHGTPTISGLLTTDVTLTNQSAQQESATANVSFLLSPRLVGFESLSFAPTAFPAAIVGQPTTMSVTVTNVDCVPISIGGMLAQPSSVTVSSETCTGTLAVNASCTVNLTWIPDSSGPLTDGVSDYGLLMASSDAQGMADTHLTGTASMPPSPPGPTPVTTYSVGLDGNGGTCTSSSVSGASGTTVELPSSGACTRDGYTMLGWNSQASGAGASFSPGGAITLTGDNTLYAMWSANPNSVPDSPGTSLAPQGPPPWAVEPTETTTVAQVPPVTVQPEQTPPPGQSVVLIGSGTDQAAVTCTQVSTARGMTTACGDEQPVNVTCSGATSRSAAKSLPQDALRAPGLYVQVLDGLVVVTNSGGAQNFTAGQFGYSPLFNRPPVILPNNPGLQFTPPPAFSSTSTSSANCSASSGAVRAAAKTTGTSVARGGVLVIQTGGLRPMSTVSAYLGATPALLGTFTTDEFGQVSAWVRVPAGQALGDTVVQVNGFTSQRYQISVLNGISVRAPQAHRAVASVKIASDARSLPAAARKPLAAFARAVPATVPVRCTVTASQASTSRLVAGYLKQRGLRCTAATSGSGRAVRVVAAYRS